MLVLLGVVASAVEARAATLPDPTRPADFANNVVVTSPDVVDWVVNGITISSQSRSAILNGSVVVRGQQVGNAVVVDILSNAVTLESNGERFNVFLRSQSVKHPVAD